MINIQKQLEALDPEALFDLAEELSSNYDLDTSKDYSQEEIEDVFKLLHASFLTGDVGKAAEAYGCLEVVCKRASAGGADRETCLDNLMEWGLMAVRFTQEEATNFVCMPTYEDLLQEFEAAPDELQYKKARILLLIAHHYQFWKNNGGLAEELPAAQRERLDAIQNEAEGAMESFIETASEAGKWEEVVRGHRALFRYYLSSKKPNDAIAEMKAMIEVLPQLPDYHAADSGDAYVTLGQLFVEYRKFGPAKKYFEKARDIYADAGEELEMFMYQAEGWIDECNKHL